MLVEDDHAVVLFESHLAIAGIAREYDDIPPVRDEPLDLVAHFLRPVFVVTSNKKALVGREQCWVIVKIDTRATSTV